jgi:hypothetical protein
VSHIHQLLLLKPTRTEAFSRIQDRALDGLAFTKESKAENVWVRGLRGEIDEEPCASFKEESLDDLCVKFNALSLSRPGKIKTIEDFEQSQPATRCFSKERAVILPKTRLPKTRVPNTEEPIKLRRTRAIKAFSSSSASWPSSEVVIHMKSDFATPPCLVASPIASPAVVEESDVWDGWNEANKALSRNGAGLSLVVRPMKPGAFALSHCKNKDVLGAPAKPSLPTQNVDLAPTSCKRAKLDSNTGPVNQASSPKARKSPVQRKGSQTRKSTIQRKGSRSPKSVVQRSSYTVPAARPNPNTITSTSESSVKDGAKQLLSQLLP